MSVMRTRQLSRHKIIELSKLDAETRQLLCADCGWDYEELCRLITEAKKRPLLDAYGDPEPGYKYSPSRMPKQTDKPQKGGKEVGANYGRQRVPKDVRDVMVSTLVYSRKQGKYYAESFIVWQNQEDIMKCCDLTGHSPEVVKLILAHMRGKSNLQEILARGPAAEE